MASEVKDVVARILGGIGSTFDDELTLSGDEARSVASLLESLFSQVEALTKERANLIETKREQIARLTRDNEMNSMRATAAEGRVALLEEERDEARKKLEDIDLCPVCVEALEADDWCLTDIELGTCHAACLAGVPMVDLDTGEPLPDGSEPPTPFRHSETLEAAEHIVTALERALHRAADVLRTGDYGEMTAAADDAMEAIARARLAKGGQP